uniref:Nudix hydrolase domain-containing protein n=1 Tax=Emiliania huxleyi TaxID=2903 RepID=A0A7S3STT4_EMIHU
MCSAAREAAAAAAEARAAMHRAGRVPALPPQPGAAAHHTEVAAPARHACLLLVGRSQRHAAPAGLLVMETGRRQRWMVPGGYVDRGDDDAAHAAFREMGEELLGLGKRAAAAQARHLLAQARHTGVLRGPFVSADGSHHAFAVLADGLVGCAAR